MMAIIRSHTLCVVRFDFGTYAFVFFQWSVPMRFGYAVIVTIATTRNNRISQYLVAADMVQVHILLYKDSYDLCIHTVFDCQDSNELSLTVSVVSLWTIVCNAVANCSARDWLASVPSAGSLLRGFLLAIPLHSWGL